MKIIFCIDAIIHSGGMERILQQITSYLADIAGNEILIVTTEQNGLAPFFPISHNVRLIDLGVDYGDASTYLNRNVIWNVIWKSFHKPIHKRRLTKVLMREKPDIVITLFNNDIGFLPKIKDGSKKIAWFHYTYTYKCVIARNSIKRFAQQVRCALWKKDLSKFDRFVVLTEEDRAAWGNMPNITVIPNFIPSLPEKQSPLTEKRAIAVGRADFQKGFDLLIEAWAIVVKSYPDWHLDIFGNGCKGLETLVSEKNLNGSVVLHSATKNITAEYIGSSLFVLSSRFEGLPMVLLEAMSCGLPVVSFECPCGPKDVIRESFGTLVPNGDVMQLAKGMMTWMQDLNKRIAGGKNARIAAEQYTQDVIMRKWMGLFETLLK